MGLILEARSPVLYHHPSLELSRAACKLSLGNALSEYKLLGQTSRVQYVHVMNTHYIESSTESVASQVMWHDNERLLNCVMVSDELKALRAAIFLDY